MGQERPRCAAHNLATGPDGFCVVCRRESHASLPPAPVATAESEPIADAGPDLVRVGMGIVASLVGLFGIFAIAYVIASGGDDDGLRAGRGIGTSDVAVDPRASRPDEREADRARRPVDEAQKPPDPAGATRALSRARSDVRIELFSTGWCPHCEHARTYLRREGLPFVEYDVEADRVASARMHRLNPRGGVPFLVVDDGPTVSGFSEAAYANAIDRAARARVR